MIHFDKCYTYGYSTPLFKDATAFVSVSPADYFTEYQWGVWTKEYREYRFYHEVKELVLTNIAKTIDIGLAE